MRPDFLKQGEIARLFPVLATTSKEGRTTSIVLACLSRVDEFAEILLASVGVKRGKRSYIDCYTLKAPEDRKSSKARLNWLLRQLPKELSEDYMLRCNWPGRSETTQFACHTLRERPEMIDEGKAGLQVLSFHVFLSKRLGPRFVQQANFISDLEEVVPYFYRKVGQNLSAWQKKAPKIKPDREDTEDVSIAAISEDAERDAT